jgi:hypothetical protein
MEGRPRLVVAPRESPFPAVLLVLLASLVPQVAGCRRSGEPGARRGADGSAPAVAADPAPLPAAEAPAPAAPAAIDAAAAIDGVAAPAASSSPSPYPAPAPDDRPVAGVTPPRLAAGWVAADAPRLYLPDDLHLLVDGGDGVFFQYGFAWAVRRSYRAEREVARTVRVEVYAFSTPEGARGRYDHDGLAAGPPWSAEPPPPELAGKVDAARVDLDQARLLRGRFHAVLQYEDPAEANLANLVEAAAPVLLEFTGALSEVLGRETEQQP